MLFMLAHRRLSKRRVFCGAAVHRYRRSWVEGRPRTCSRATKRGVSPGAASGCLTCSRKSPDGVIGTLKFLCPSEGRNGARIANSNSRPECLVTGAEFVWTYCTKATPPSRLIVYARIWYRVQIGRALRLTEILTNSETPSELTLALPGDCSETGCPAAWTSPMIRQDVGRILRRLRHTWRYASASQRAAASGVPNRRKPVSR
jgi:hypothetical protein